MDDQYKAIAKRKARLAEYFDSVLKSFPVPFFTTDVEGCILRVNAPLETLINHKQHELVGRLTTELIGGLPEDWFKQESKTFKSALFGYDAVINSQEDEKDRCIGYVVVLIKANEIEFQSNW